MVIASIMKFISTIPHLNGRGILEVDTIIGYGMAYTGIGCIGFYKLNMKFGGQTEIISKLDISQRPQQYAAERQYLKVRMGDVDYSRIRDILVLRPCVVEFALRNLRDIYFLQMALVVWSVFVVWRYTNVAVARQ